MAIAKVIKVHAAAKAVERYINSGFCT
jgi:hypothetical protein